MNTQTPQPLTLDILKNVMLCLSNDTTRPTLMGARLRITSPGVCQIGATDVHIAVRYENICLASVRELFKTEYGVSLKEVDGRELRDYIIYPDHKLRKKAKKNIVECNDRYPDLDNVIPSRGDCPSDIAHFPMYHIDILQTVKKITGSPTFYPDYWVGVRGASIKEIDEYGSILLVMPVRPARDWAHYEAWKDYHAK